MALCIIKTGCRTCSWLPRWTAAASGYAIRYNQKFWIQRFYFWLLRTVWLCAVSRRALRIGFVVSSYCNFVNHLIEFRNKAALSALGSCIVTGIFSPSMSKSKLLNIPWSVQTITLPCPNSKPIIPA